MSFHLHDGPLEESLIHLWGDILNNKKIYEHIKMYPSRSQCEKYLHFLRRNYQTEEVKFNMTDTLCLEMTAKLKNKKYEVNIKISSGHGIYIKYDLKESLIKQEYVAIHSDFYSLFHSYHIEKYPNNCWRRYIVPEEFDAFYQNKKDTIKKYYRAVCIPDWFLPDLWNIVVEYVHI